LLLQNPNDDFEFIAKGVGYEELRSHDIAIANFDKAIERDPQKISVYIRRGRVYFQKGDFDRALADFDKAIQLESTKTTAVEQSSSNSETKALPPPETDPRPWLDLVTPGAAYLDRGKTYLQKDDYDRAIADFTTALQLDSDKAGTYNLRGVAYENKGDFDSAIADFDKAIRMDPRLRNAHYNRGLAFSGKGDEVRARADFNEEKQLYPGVKSSADDPKTNILNGRAVKLAKPQYPAAARKGHVAGLVVVHVLIDEQGKVIAAEALSGPALLQDACVKAAMNSVFTPTILAGTPVKVSGVVQYNFVAQ
jgi:tetratricopeptide (TPR) repeat protein